jgi:hypothetical protein
VIRFVGHVHFFYFRLVCLAFSCHELGVVAVAETHAMQFLIPQSGPALALRRKHFIAPVPGIHPLLHQIVVRCSGMGDE